MKRLVVLLGGITPVSGAKQTCQVLAADRSRSCSIVATGTKISAMDGDGNGRRLRVRGGCDTCSCARSRTLTAS